MDTDCIEDRKRMIIFSIFGSWEPYDAVDWIEKVSVHFLAMEFISNILQFPRVISGKTFKI
jgi:hypothetical protein